MNNYYGYGLPSTPLPTYGYPQPLISNDIKITPPVQGVQGVQQSLPQQAPQPQQTPNLGLRQLQDFQMVPAFQDSDARVWKLVKEANDPSVEIPDPQFVQVTDYWNHEFPGSDGKVFIYVVQGVKQPRVDTEKPVNVLYQWFSTVNQPNFTPMMISTAEWHRANVYTSPMGNSRLSMLKALCRCSETQVQVKQDVKDIPSQGLQGSHPENINEINDLGTLGGLNG